MKWLLTLFTTRSLAVKGIISKYITASCSGFGCVIAYNLGMSTLHNSKLTLNNDLDPIFGLLASHIFIPAGMSEIILELKTKTRLCTTAWFSKFLLFDEQLLINSCTFYFKVPLAALQFSCDSFVSRPQIETENSNKSVANLERILEDYKAIRQENSALAAKVREG